MINKRGLHFGFIVAVLALLLAATAFLVEHNGTPGPLAETTPVAQNSGQPSSWDDFVRQVREGLVTREMIASQKEALGQELAQVTPGTASQDAYLRHCQSFMQLMGDDPARCEAPFLPPQPPPPGPSPVPTIVATIQPSLTMAEAWGTDIKVETIPLMYGADYRLICNTITPDGQYLVCEAMSLDFGADMDRHGGTRPGKVVLVDVHSHAVTEIRTLSRNDAQAFGTDADDKQITWVEAAEAIGLSDAVLFTYDRATHALTSQPFKGVQHPTLTDPTSHGVMVWTDSFVLQGGVLRKKVLATRQTEVLAQNALQPKISWPYVAWLQVRESTPDITTYSITVLNLDTGQRKTLRDPYSLSYDIDGNTIVWATRPGEVVLTDVDETYRQVLVRKSYGEFIEGLNINDRLVSWMAISSSNGQVWDRELGRLVTLDGANVSARFLSGKYLMWESSMAQDLNRPPGKMDTDLYINVLDTSTLPK